ncbi:MAG: U32 family peptidase [Bacteroidales bacterium]|jgi:putative protease|nr:U32 family peptidase [Bacteroidales bacterium]
MDKKDNKIEIMSPVGSYESLMAAIQGGADAVYFGVGQLNMRSRSAVNFTADDLKQISAICKTHAVRSYLTVNTIIYDEELSDMHRLLDSAKENGLTAVIASDLSVIRYAESIGLEVHISTQCNITNIEAVRFFARYADVMVLARELSLKQVRAIIRQIEQEKITGPSGNLVQIEIFVHGALCMAVSGKCYLSLDNFRFSANRGSCLQPCRRAYRVEDEDKEVELLIDNKYIMSPKDLCTIGFLDKILQAGVTVLKIEGRGRSPEYVKTVTHCYREAAEAYLAGTYSEEKVKQWTHLLGNVYNRGFWDGYYLGRKLGEWTQRYGSQARKTKVYVGKITNFFAKLRVAEVKIESNALFVGDEYVVIGTTTGVYEDTVKEIRVELNAVEAAQKGDICSIPTHDTVRRNDKLYKIIPLCNADDYDEKE